MDVVLNSERVIMNNRHQAMLQLLYKQRDVQGAAQYLAKFNGINLQNAMDIATEIGFHVEFYNDSIRVEIAGPRRKVWAHYLR